MEVYDCYTALKYIVFSYSKHKRIVYFQLVTVLYIFEFIAICVIQLTFFSVKYDQLKVHDQIYCTCPL